MPKNSWILAAAWLGFHIWASDLSAASSVASRAGNPFVITSWDTDRGLPQNSVTSIIQTRDGYLWLGTQNGLVRFDGIRFVVFDESNTPGLNSSRIVKLFEDRQRNLWVGTETAGVVLIKEGQVTGTGIGLGAFEKRLASICEDADGAVWLYTANGELWRYWNKRFTPFRFDLFRPSDCRALMAEPAGPVWIGTDGRQAAIGSTPDLVPLELQVDQDLPMIKLDYLLASQRGGYWRLADGRIQKCRTNRVERDLGPYPWLLDVVTTACEDLQGNLLVGTRSSGVFWFGTDDKVTWLSTRLGLSHDSILSLCMDNEGNLWVGTDRGGLNRVRRQVFEVLDQSQDPAVNPIQSVCADRQGGLWIGSNGGGAAYWRNGVWQRFGPNQGLVNLNVSAVFVDQQERVWVGTKGAGLFQWQNGQFQPAPGAATIPQVILAIHEDRRGRLWLGTLGGLAGWDGRSWTLFTTRDGLSADEVRAIADDADGTLWIGTVGGGLNRLRDGQFTAFHKQPNGLPSEDISSLYLDREGVLWIGTFGSGLARMHQGKWIRYTRGEGLISNSIGYLIEDDQGYFWMGSNAGLMRVQKRDLNHLAQGLTHFIPCRAYGKPDGLPTRECSVGSQPAAGRTPDGKLWFPTVKGLVSVNPAQLNPNPYPPPVVIESVLIDDQLQNTNALLVGLPQALTVPAGKERVEIHYTSLNLAAPDKGRFRYRLEEHETEWIEATNTRVAIYSRLQPGHYRFRVKACNEDGVWNEAGNMLELTVEPPFWRTWWFRSVAVATLLGVIIVVVYYFSTQRLQRQLERLKQQEALEQERSRIAQDIHDQLGASLTQVALLGELVESDKAHPEEVEAHAQQISQTARETTRVLDEIVWAVNPSNDTLDGLVTYVCKHAQDYLAVAGLRYRLDVPAQLPTVGIPPEFRHNIFLAFKEAITNIVRHAQASAVWVRLKLEPAAFVLEIEDNGRGGVTLDEKTALSRNGLRGMRKRMEAIGGSFDIGPAPERGTRVRLAAPLGSVQK
jgi:ligand-binding sensor domain-containing protein/signal transduction histidine kinase